MRLLNSLSDFDGQISPEIFSILDELQQRSDPLPPLYADVFGLFPSSTCADLVQHIDSLSQEQVAVASYAFQIFRSYEQMLKLDTTEMAPEQRAACESQMERIRSLVNRAKTAMTESIESISDQ
ncbi:MAG: hypothetical protein HC772_05060 [Leptolyngbyaceae cyanobacterium CRU_2_3]|nr:hypothetical protein [Leptolyngbyaceae cyanobacterium CRU_2_3]